MHVIESVKSIFIFTTDLFRRSIVAIKKICFHCASLNIFVVSKLGTIQHVRVLQVLHSAIIDGGQHGLQPKTDGRNLVENSTLDASDEG